MSELLGRESNDSGWMNLGVTKCIIQMLQDLAVPRNGRCMVKKPLIYILYETCLNELFWFRTDVQNSIKYNALIKEVFENGKQHNPKNL